MRRTMWRYGKRSAALTPLALGLLLNAACGDSPVAPTGGSGESLTAQSISLSGLTALQHPGERSQLTAIATFSDGTTRDVSSTAGWEMDHPGVASVDRTGMVTAQAYGQCNVTVRYGTASGRAPVRVVPVGMYLLSGHVYEESGMPLFQARVTVRSSSGDLSTTTGYQGTYMLPASGDVEVRAEMDDFDAQARRVTVMQDASVDFHLKFKRTQFGGMYRLLFTAAPSCALPAEAMRRTYMARVEERTAGDLVVILSGAEFVVWGEAGFTGRREGSRLRFSISSDYSTDYQFIEQLDPVARTEFALSGTATGEVGQTIVTTFNGNALVRERLGRTIAQCEAGDHRLEFAR